MDKERSATALASERVPTPFNPIQPSKRRPSAQIERTVYALFCGRDTYHGRLSVENEPRLDKSSSHWYIVTKFLSAIGVI
jgi:hypothetical protein